MSNAFYEWQDLVIIFFCNCHILNVNQSRTAIISPSCDAHQRQESDFKNKLTEDTYY